MTNTSTITNPSEVLELLKGAGWTRRDVGDHIPVGTSVAIYWPVRSHLHVEHLTTSRVISEGHAEHWTPPAVVSTSDVRERQAEKDQGVITAKVTVDTDELREWAGKHADLHPGVAHVLYATARQLETGEVPAFLDGGESPPPAEPPVPVWSVLSTDREKPTLAKVTWSAPTEYVTTAEVFVEDGYVWRVMDSTAPDEIEGSRKIGRTEGVVSVTVLATLDPSTHVPVERALIDEIVRIGGLTPPLLRALDAALADGNQS